MREKEMCSGAAIQAASQPPSHDDANIDANIGQTDELQPVAPSTVWEAFRSALSRWGIYREYPTRPSYDPYATNLSSISEHSPVLTEVECLPPKLQDEPTNPYFPFTNSSLFGLLSWKWVGSNSKSDMEFGKLFGFLKSAEFSQADITSVNIDSEIAKVDKYINGSASTPVLHGNGTSAQGTQGGWREVAVSISIPDGELHSSLADAPVFEVPGLHYQSLTEVIRNSIGDPNTGRHFHYTPYKQFFSHDVHIPDLPLDDRNSELPPPPTRIFDEVYTCNAMIDAHLELQQQPFEDDCKLERVVAAVMLYSDSTHLASFGTASAWPIYLSFGNESKYVRCKPSTGSCHHVAYIPKVRCMPICNSFNAN